MRWPIGFNWRAVLRPRTKLRRHFRPERRHWRVRDVRGEQLEARDLLTTIGLPDAPLPTKDDGETRIVGGTTSAPGAWPWAASLQDATHFCGATLIAPDALVTAAHCVEGTSPSSLNVVLGRSDLSSTNGKSHRVDEIIVHPDYNSYTNESDIAILMLSTVSSLKPLPMLHADQSELAAPEVDAIVAGWGVLSEGSSRIPNELHEVPVPIVANEVANEPNSYDGRIADTMLAAGYAAGGKDSCSGDSGGPLMVTDANGQHYLAGIVSWGNGCARPNSYGIYTRMTSFADWVDKRVQLAPLGSVNLTQERYAAGQSAHITLGDTTLIGAGSVAVGITADNGDQEEVVLHEGFPGRFSGEIALSAAPVTAGDGILQVDAAQTIDVVYHDLDDGHGEAFDVHDIARIVVDDFGNDAATSQAITADSSIEAEIELSGDVDWFRLAMQADRTYTITSQLNGSLNDSVLALYAADGTTLLQRDDDGGEGLAATIAWFAAADDTIYIAASGYGSNVGTYTLVVEEQHPKDDDHGNSHASATPLEVGSEVHGEIGVRFDQDWFSFTATAGATYTISTELETLNDSILRLLAPDGVTELAFNDDYDNDLGSRIVWRAPTSATFFVQVVGYEVALGTYEVSLSEEIVVGDDHGNVAATASPLAFPADIPGQINQSEDLDWFAFEAIYGGQYVFTVVLEQLPDSILRLIDAAGNELAYNDDYDISLASRIAWTAPSTDTYYVEVRAYGASNLGTYRLTASETLPIGDDDHGDTPEEATQLDNLPVHLLANVNQPDDVDYFKFDAVAGLVYVLETSPGTLNDSQIVLYGPDGTSELARDDDSGIGFGARLIWQAPATDAYYLAVSGYGTETGNYELWLHIPFGDANRDGRFDSSDLVAVFAAGFYESPEFDAVTWEQGDWNGDGRFTTADLIAAFQYGGYERDESPDE